MPVITLMLDVSGSMDRIDSPNNCNLNGNDLFEDRSYGYTTYYCKVGREDRYYRRIDNLKMGVSDMVNSPELKGKVKLGVGTYPLASASNGKAEVSGNGHIDIPVDTLTTAHATVINTFIATLQPTWNTPIAQSYGEVGAYMMGTKTNNKTTTSYYLNKETYKVDKGLFGLGIDRGSDEKCTQWNNIKKNEVL